MDTDNDEEAGYTLHKLIKDGMAYEKKILMKVNKLNADLRRSKQKTIKFYGSFNEPSEVAAMQDISFVQEQQMVTKDEFTKFQTDFRAEAQASQSEFRNETQATIQSALATVRNDIVGDVKTLFTSLEKKIDQQQSTQQANQQSDSRPRFDRRDDERSYDRGMTEAGVPTEAMAEAVVEAETSHIRGMSRMPVAELEGTESIHRAVAFGTATSVTNLATHSCDAQSSTTRRSLRRRSWHSRRSAKA